MLLSNGVDLEGRRLDNTGLMKLRFRRHQRVIKSGDFARAYRLGGRARGTLLQVVVVPNELEYSRLGLSVGKAVWKSAVRRNRVRRIFREAFRLEQTQIPAGFDWVLIPASKRLQPELEATRAELRKLAPKATRRALERAERRRADEAASQ